jgi:dTDP-4-dehydrorhamnose reductase
MKALIFGAGGQLGRALAKTAPPDTALVALDRAQCDVTDPDAVARAIGAAAPDLVLNAAAYTAVDKAEAEPEAARRLNALAPGIIALAARAAGARTIHVSTDFVFDGAASTPYRPGDAAAPCSVYGRTKLEGERAVAAADSGALIVRSAWLYAAEGANFVNAMLSLMRTRGEVSVVCDQIGTPTWAPSLAAALWSLAGKGARGLWHHTDCGVASWYDFAVAIAEEGLAAGLLAGPVSVRPIAAADYPTAARRPAFSLLEKAATWELLGKSAPHWRVNLRRNVQELKAHG